MQPLLYNCTNIFITPPNSSPKIGVHINHKHVWYILLCDMVLNCSFLLHHTLSICVYTGPSLALGESSVASCDCLHLHTVWQARRMLAGKRPGK
jgi:hypothetical protein